MIDLHCHVLPGIDDGPASLDSSLALAAAAASTGTRAIVATPHVSRRYRNDARTIERGVEALRASLAEARTELELFAGAEIATSSLPEIAPEELAKLTLGGGGWLLLEPPFAPLATGLDALVGGLLREGYKIVIAHPERCAAFHRDPVLLSALVRWGALTSVTAGSLSGRFGSQARRFALRLFDEGLVHNVASDAHDSVHRPPEIAAEIERAGLGDLGEWLTELVPAAILAGERIPPRPARSHARRRRMLRRLIRR